MITKKKVASFRNRDVWEYTMKNNHGMEVSVLNYGGVIHRLVYPDRNGIKKNRILAYKDMDIYEENPMFFGALIGRIAGRISQAMYSLQDGKVIHLEVNEGHCNLHGGSQGFHHCFWEVTSESTEQTDSLSLEHIDVPHDGWESKLHVTVTYSLTNQDELRLHYHVETNAPDICNMTNHMYFNLDGMDASAGILSHELYIGAEQVQLVDQDTIPTGEYLDCSTEPVFDFRKLRSIGMYGMEHHPQQSLVHDGYDHAFRFTGSSHVAKLISQQSGICLEVCTSEEAVVVYTCNKVDQAYPLENGILKKYAGVTLETQALPDRIHSSNPNEIIITPDNPYDSETVFSFSSLDDMETMRRIPLLFW